jgi:RNA polymerase sigma-70 factor (ECF subfamily)
MKARIKLSENTAFQSIRRWLRKANEGAIPNSDAFARLYEETYLPVFRYVYGLSGGPTQEAEDLTAETYARAWKTHQRFRGNRQAALGWLLRIARNLVIDVSRHRKISDLQEKIDIEGLTDPKLIPELDIISRQQIQTLWQMLGTLSEEVREILVLRYMLGWQVKQIAVHLGMSENRVSVTIRRALQSLRHAWPQEEDDE